MILKVDGYELEILENSDVYLGIPQKGQTFKNLGELNEQALARLKEIQAKAAELIRQTEALLCT